MKGDNHMKKRVLFITAITVIASYVIPVAAQVAPNVKVTNFPKVTKTTPSRTVWKYKYVTLKTLINATSDRDLLYSEEGLNKKIEEALNKLGHQGWELIHVGDQGYLFKRPGN